MCMSTCLQRILLVKLYNLQGVLTPALLCCPSGNIDRCGVCDGDGTACPTLATVSFVNTTKTTIGGFLRGLRAHDNVMGMLAAVHEDVKDVPDKERYLWNGMGYVDIFAPETLDPSSHPLGSAGVTEPWHVSNDMEIQMLLEDNRGTTHVLSKEGVFVKVATLPARNPAEELQAMAARAGVSLERHGRTARRLLQVCFAQHIGAEVAKFAAQHHCLTSVHQSVSN